MLRFVREEKPFASVQKPFSSGLLAKKILGKLFACDFQVVHNSLQVGLFVWTILYYLKSAVCRKWHWQGSKP